MKRHMTKINGFTLIELLGVIVIIGLLALIVYPLVNRTIQKNKEKLYEQQIATIEKNAYDYSAEYMNTFPTEEDIIITFDTLKEKGYLKDEEIKDPRTSKPLEGCVLARWNEDLKQYSFKYDEKC